MIAFAIPLPPSANRLWKNRKGRGAPYMAPEYSSWKQEAGWQIKASRIDRMAGDFDIQILVPKAMPGDVDNRIKAILDLCKEHVTDDDRFAQDVRITRSAEVPKGICIVRISNSTTADAGVVRQGAAFTVAPNSDEARRGVSPRG